MSHLMALSFDCPTSPALTLKPAIISENEKELYQGWGFGWYPGDGHAAAIIKDSRSNSSSMATRVLSDWKRFYSTVFLCYLRGAAKRTNQQDTQPFNRSYAGRDWILSHNGDLNGGYKNKLLLSGNPLFEPIGITDSEYLFCWLMEKIQQANARAIADINWNDLHQWLMEINQCGSANILFSDGNDLVIYQDQQLFNPLYWSRHHPPHEQTLLESDFISMDISNEQAQHRTFTLISTYQPFCANTQPMEKSQLLVIRRGSIIWNSSQGLPLFLDNQPIAEKLPENREGNSDVVATQLTPQSTTPVNPNENVVFYYSSQQNEQAKKLIVLNVSHETIYRYDRLIEFSTHYFRLHPVQDRYQDVLEHKISLFCPGESETFDDVFGNRATFVHIDIPYTELKVHMTAKIRLRDIPTTYSSQLQLTRQTIPIVWMPWQRQMMNPYLLPPELPESQLSELTDFAMSFAKRNDYDVLELVKDINRTIYHDFSYQPGTTNVQTTAYEVFVQRKGVCQDFANLFISLARLLSIPARYRSGYIHTGNNYENKLQSEATHAWVELYIPWLGWRGFDPTNGCLTGKDHIRLACGRNYSDATPTSGTIFVGGGCETLTVDVKVELEV